MSATTAIKPKNRVEKFTELLDALPFHQRYDLHKLLGHVGSHRLTRLLNPLNDRLGDFNATEVGALANLLNMTPQDLIMNWGLGRNTITLDEADALVADEGYVFGLVNHIA